MRGAAADLLVGVLDAIDVGVGLRFVEAGARLGLDFDRELVALELAVALERHAIDDLRALVDRDDHLAVDDLRAHLREHAGRREVRDGAIDARLVGAGEIRTNRRRVGMASRPRRRCSERKPAPPPAGKSKAELQAKATATRSALKYPRKKCIWLVVPVSQPGQTASVFGAQRLAARRVLADSRHAPAPARLPAAGRATC